jgi:carboxymethylenebutenolidase
MSPSDPRLLARAIALYDRYAHVTHDRRAFMAELTALAGSAVAAQALLAGIAPDEAAAAVVAADDPRLTAGPMALPGAAGRSVNGYLVRPGQPPARRIGAVLVIHENRGLNDHIRDVARRVALAGYIAFAPDFLSVAGGTPPDPDKARQMIGALDLAATVADGVALIGALGRLPGSNGKVGAVGFCWGGAMTNRLAVAAGGSLAAAVPYYGPAPDPREAVGVKAAMVLHYAGLDERVNASGRPWVEALKAAGVRHQAWFYEGAQHAFNNDTSAERYDKAAADLAWSRTLELFARELG